MPRFFLFLQLFDTKKDASGREQKSSWLRVCGCLFGQVSEICERWTKYPPRLASFHDVKERDTPVMYRSIGQLLKPEEARPFLWGKGPKYNNASIIGQQMCSYDTYGKNDLALQPPPPRQMLRFDFNAFCVVLYFHAKILLYLNVFYFIKCVHFFFFGYYILELL